MPLEIRLAYQDIDQIRILFQEYTQMLGIDLAFQNFDAEFSNLPGDYALPDGRLYLAEYDGFTAGCIAIHPFDGVCCEIKRLYVRPAFRGKSIGRALVEQVIADAREMHYSGVMLDTMAFLENSVALYRKLGFQETEPYRYNPMPDALYFRLNL